MLSVQINTFHYEAFPEKEILNDISFQVKQGTHLALLGESGCGKSTVLHLIYGTLELSKGQILYNNEQLWGPSRNLIPGHSFMKLVEQEYNIMPFISVAENIAAHLDRKDKTEDETRVNRLLEVVGLTAHKNTKAKHLSGGQKQRVALAKALAKKPKVILLDEPFSSIDTFQKTTLRRTLFQFLKEEGITCITATHESEEALSFADEIIILKKGKIHTKGTPTAIYNTITSDYQGRFFDDVTTLGGALLGLQPGSKKHYLLPHQLKISESKTPLKVVVKNNFFKGAYYRVLALSGKNQEVYFNHHSKLSKDVPVFLKYKKV